MLFIVDRRKKMYNKLGYVCKEIINIVGNSKIVL